MIGRTLSHYRITASKSALRTALPAIALAIVALPLALPWVALHPRRILSSPFLYVASGIAWLYFRTTPLGTPLLLASVAGLGAAVIADLLIDARRRVDGVQLLMGVWILVPIVIVPYLHLPPKYLVAAAPAVAIAVGRAAEKVSRVRARAILLGTLALGFALGVLILRADANLAGLGRKAAIELIPTQGAARRAVGAGFYSNDFGIWPWAWGREPVDRYESWSVESTN